MKKLVSMFLALVMALSLTIPAFASSGTVKVEGSIQVPTLNVVLPTTASMILNPYSMDVTLVKGEAAVHDQVISPVMEVTNLSNIGIQVGVQIAGTKGKGDVTFSNASTATSTTKNAFIYAVFKIGATGMTIADPTNVTADAANVAILDEPAAGSTTGTLKDVTNFETTAGAAADADNTLAATVLDPVSNKQVAAPTGVLGFKFFGDTSPVTTWTDKDILGATLAFTFTPVAVDNTPSAGDASVTLDKSTLTLDSTTTTSDTVTATFNVGSTSLTAASYAWATDNACVTLTNDNTAAVTIAHASAGTANVTVTVTLDNGATVTETCVVTCNT